MLQSSKATQNTEISSQLTKDNADIFAEFVSTSLNKCIEQSVFPSKLNLANITLVHKKNLKKLKTQLQTCQYVIKYSKVYEKFMFIQMSEYFGAVLTDLSKALDCLSHDLLITKLNAYEFSIAALTLCYLSNRKKRTKINSDFSCCEEFLFGAPQGPYWDLYYSTFFSVICFS